MLTTNHNVRLPAELVILKIKKNLIVQILLSNDKTNLPKTFFKDIKYTYMYSNSFLEKVDLYNLIFYGYCVQQKKDIYKLTKFFNKNFIFFWLKITFRGKGFRVRKFFKSQKLTLNFGHSHWAKFKFKNTKIFLSKIRRQNYILLTWSFFTLYSIMYSLRFVKLINRYTKRGLRLKKQKIKKRYGKISQMISSLHF